MKFGVRVPDARKEIERRKRGFLDARHKAAIRATDLRSKTAQRALQAKIRGVGLGRLGNAIGQTSTLKLGRAGSDDKPFGVIFARGGDESLAGGALESYNRGSVIRARRGTWLAIATRAIPKFVSLGGRRFRTTPELYRASSLASSIGALEFKPISSTRALLVIKNVTVSPKTGRAKADLGRRTRTRVKQKEIVAFILIRVTTRAKRFDKDAIIGPEADKIADDIANDAGVLLWT